MKVLVLGDSFGLPRFFKKSDEIEVRSEDIYPEQLRQLLKSEFKQEDIMMINMSKRFNNSLFLLKREFNEVYLMQPEYLIIQVGIVDCWAREDGSYICEEFKGKNPWISEEEYIAYLKKFINDSFKLIKSLKSIIVVNITKASNNQYNRHRGSYERTIRYNKRLEGLKNIDNLFILDLYDEFDKSIEEVLCSDGLHPSKYGNYLIAEKIFNAIISNAYYEFALKSLNKNEVEDSIKYFEKIYKLGLKGSTTDLEATKNLILYYLNNSRYEKLKEILNLEEALENNCSINKSYKDLAKFIAEKISENNIIELKHLKEKYFILLDCLIKFDEIDLFNSVINKFIKEYDCISYEKHGNIMRKYGLDDLATESFVKAIELGSNSSQVYSYISQKFLEINEIDDALNFAFTALNINSKNLNAYDVIINIYKTIGELDKVNEFVSLKNKHCS